MHSTAAPLGTQLGILFIAPPVMASLWWLASRNFGNLIQGGSVSERTKKRQTTEFWVLLAAMYALVFGIKIYAVIKGF
jgi:hypothetical protein